MLDGLGKRGKHLPGELRARVDSAAASALAEPIANVVVEVSAPCVVAGRLDSHDRRILHIGSLKLFCSGD